MIVPMTSGATSSLVSTGWRCFSRAMPTDELPKPALSNWYGRMLTKVYKIISAEASGKTMRLSPHVGIDIHSSVPQPAK